MLRTFFTAAIVICWGTPTFSASVFFSKENFISNTGAVSEPSLPNLGIVEAGPVTVGSLTFSTPDSSFYIGNGDLPDWDATILGNDIAINDTENLSIEVQPGITGIGFFLDDVDTDGIDVVGSCDVAECTPTEFKFDFFISGDLIFSFTENRGEGLSFYGFDLEAEFDLLQITDVTATSDDEYFGDFYTSTAAIRPDSTQMVPIPAAFPLLASVIAGFGLMVWQKR